jgi:hypothetical protein
MHRILIFLLTAALAACGSSALSDDATAPSADLMPSATPSASIEPTPAERSEPPPSPQPSAARSLAAGMTVSGTLNFDQIEGGCTSLNAEDGTRYEVIWPDGWTLDSSSNLIDASGAVVAQVGDTVTVAGRITHDMASICQIGPIFEALGVTVAE